MYGPRITNITLCQGCIFVLNFWDCNHTLQKNWIARPSTAIVFFIIYLNVSLSTTRDPFDFLCHISLAKRQKTISLYFFKSLHHVKVDFFFWRFSSSVSKYSIYWLINKRILCHAGTHIGLMNPFMVSQWGSYITVYPNIIHDMAVDVTCFGR